MTEQERKERCKKCMHYRESGNLIKGNCYDSDFWINQYEDECDGFVDKDVWIKEFEITLAKYGFEIKKK